MSQKIWEEVMEGKDLHDEVDAAMLLLEYWVRAKPTYLPPDVLAQFEAEPMKTMNALWPLIQVTLPISEVHSLRLSTREKAALLDTISETLITGSVATLLDNYIMLVEHGYTPDALRRQQLELNIIAVMGGIAENLPIAPESKSKIMAGELALIRDRITTLGLDYAFMHRALTDPEHTKQELKEAAAAAFPDAATLAVMLKQKNAKPDDTILSDIDHHGRTGKAPAPYRARGENPSNDN